MSVGKLPGIPHVHAVRALEKAGFRIVRQSKHIVMSNVSRVLTIPRSNPVNAYTMVLEMCIPGHGGGRLCVSGIQLA